MLTHKQHEEILELIDEEKNRLGTFSQVAKKCGVSTTTISQLRSGTYAGKTDGIMQEIGRRLGYDFATEDWEIAEITNYEIIMQVLKDSRNESMFMGVANCAGSGKTATSSAFLGKHRNQPVYLIRAKEWNAHAFLMRIAQEAGIGLPSSGYVKINTLIELISEHFNRIASSKPLLIIDQGNSLKDSALRSIIHLFNECEDVLGLTILGTEALETTIKRGVRLNKTGYDELDSRFGRVYIHLVGANLLDCRKICTANGIDDPDLQKNIFEKCEPIKKCLEGADGNSVSVRVVEDIRRIKRLVKSTRLKQKHNG